MKQHYRRYLPDSPSTILFLLFCTIYFLKVGQDLPLTIFTRGLKPFLLLLAAKGQ